MEEVQFCNQCYYMRTYEGFNNGKPGCRYVCVNGDSPRAVYTDLDFWQQACPHAKPRDWRPPSITPTKQTK